LRLHQPITRLPRISQGRFTPRLRYSHFSLGFHFASITAGGSAPLIATALLAWTGSGYVIALYILLSAAVTFASAIFLPDLTNSEMSQEVAWQTDTFRSACWSGGAGFTSARKWLRSRNFDARHHSDRQFLSAWLTTRFEAIGHGRTDGVAISDLSGRSSCRSLLWLSTPGAACTSADRGFRADLRDGAPEARYRAGSAGPSGQIFARGG